METKICKICLIPQILDNFPSRMIKNKLYYDGRCKLCISDYNKEYQSSHREEIKNLKLLNADKIREQKKEYIRTHKKEIKERNKEYKIKNALKIKERSKEYKKQRKIKDPAFKVRANISRIISRALIANDSSKYGKSIFEFLPYTMLDLKKHLENQFESWMTWQNYGRYLAEVWDDNNCLTWAWNIDHIIPQSELLYSSMSDENFQKCWALNNLRPLSAKQNNLDGTLRTRHNLSK